MFDQPIGSPGNTAVRKPLVREPVVREPKPLTPKLTELASIRDARRVLDLRESELLADRSVQDDCMHRGHRTAGWIADTHKISSTAAKAKFKLSINLHTHYPALVVALRDGLIGWNHIAAFDRAANPRVRSEMIALLPDLIALAGVAGFDRWQQEIRGIAERLDQDGAYDPAKDPTNNELHLTNIGGGYTKISGQLVGELAFQIKTIIDTETERILRQYHSDNEQTTSSNLVDPATPQDIPTPSRGQAAAEALAELLQRGSGTPDGEGRMPEPEMIAHYNSDTETLTDEQGNHLSPTMLRWFIAAAMIRPLELSSTGDPLRMGHALRYANRHQRRALTIRDGGCIFPGCTRPPNWCDAHHIDHWENSGPTDIENLALLCRHHHRVTHQPGWHMERDPDTAPEEVRFRWTTPLNCVIHSQRHHTQNADLPNPGEPPGD